MNQLVDQFIANGGKIQNIPPLPANKRPNFWGYKLSIASRGRKKQTLRLQGWRIRNWVKESKEEERSLQHLGLGKRLWKRMVIKKLGNKERKRQKRDEWYRLVSCDVYYRRAIYFVTVGGCYIYVTVW